MNRLSADEHRMSRMSRLCADENRMSRLNADEPLERG